MRSPIIGVNMLEVCINTGQIEGVHAMTKERTLLGAGLLAELLDQLVNLGMHHHFILIPDAVLTQEVKLDVIAFQALNILHLHSARPGTTQWKQLQFTFHT